MINAILLHLFQKICHEFRQIGALPVKSRVLVIQNDPSLYTEIQNALCSAAIIVDVVFSPSEAVDLFLHYDYSLILIDADTGGKDIIKPLRAITSAPILALCGQNNQKERCNLLETGASACLTKPIYMQECVAQVKALLNLYFATNEKRAIHTVAYGTEFVIDPEFRTVFFKGKSIKMSRREFDLLFYLASHHLEVFSKQQLYEQVWGYIPCYSVDNAVKSCIKKLRRLLGPDGRKYIQTVRGVGYRFVDVQSSVI